jgi:hypothetical protein
MLVGNTILGAKVLADLGERKHGGVDWNELALLNIAVHARVP